MTIVDRGTEAPAWINQTDLANASGLRQDLIARFVPPAAHTPTGPMWSPTQLNLAVYVKELTERNLPPEVIDEKVRAFLSPPGHALTNYPSAPTAKTGVRSPRNALTRVAAALACLIIGGLVGGVIGARTTGENPGTAAPQNETAAAVPASPAIPTNPDPVCARWVTLLQRAIDERAEWVQIPPTLSAAQWSPEQREIVRAVEPKLRSQAAAINDLADAAGDPTLAGVLRIIATYQSAFTDRLPEYVPADDALWRVVSSTGETATSLCRPMG